MVVHGSQQAIDLCTRVLLDPGDAFVFEGPGYLVARRCFEATGATLLAVRVDANGLLSAAARDRGVGVYPVSPLFAAPPPPNQPRPAGLVLGYAALTVEQIQQGIRGLAGVIASQNVDEAPRR